MKFYNLWLFGIFCLVGSGNGYLAAIQRQQAQLLTEAQVHTNLLSGILQHVRGARNGEDPDSLRAQARRGELGPALPTGWPAPGSDVVGWFKQGRPVHVVPTYGLIEAHMAYYRRYHHLPPKPSRYAR